MIDKDGGLDDLERGAAERAAPGTTSSAAIVARALECGADLAGVARIEDLRVSPSHRIYPLLEGYSGVGTKDAEGRARGQIDWPADALSVVVLAVRHPEERPELDWWVDGLRGGTAGNRLLIDAAGRLASWLRDAHGIGARVVPYHIEKGGVFLKDAAVLAGLGCVGRNNLLVTPEYGPRVRLRVLALDRDVTPTGPVDFDPCADCAMPCRTACPREVMAQVVRDEARYGQSELPARDGVYDRVRCDVQMQADVGAHEVVARDDTGEPGRLVRYCRLCETSCWVGAVT